MAPRAARLVLLTVLTAGYTAFFWFASSSLGAMSGALGLIPVAAGAYLFGVRGGLGATAGVIIGTTLIRLQLGEADQVQSAQTLVGILSLLVVAVGGGLVHDFALKQIEREHEARRAQADLAALIDGIPDAIVRVTPAGVVIDSWRSALLCDAFQRPPMPGATLAQCAGPEMLARLEAMIGTVRPTVTQTAVIIYGDPAGPCSLETRVSPTSNGDLLLLFRDVTIEKRLGARLVAAERDKVMAETQVQVGQSHRLAALGTLAAGIAHEINNPLTYVTSSLEFLATAPDSVAAAERREVLDDALAGVRRIGTIVRDMRALSRESSSDAPSPVSVQRSIQAAANLAKGEVASRAMLNLELGDLPPVLGSDARLGQVFVNLFVNAAQAMPDRPLAENSIQVCATWLAGAASVIVVVEDNGVGMAPEVLARMFDPFFTTKPVGIGTGLGLSISRTIIEKMGGNLTVRSAPGQGTSIAITLPAIA